MTCMVSGASTFHELMIQRLGNVARSMCGRNKCQRAAHSHQLLSFHRLFIGRPARSLAASSEYEITEAASNDTDPLRLFAGEAQSPLVTIRLSMRAFSRLTARSVSVK